MIKTSILTGICIVLLLSPLIIRLLPDIEPIEHKYLLLTDWSKFFIEFLILVYMLMFLTHSLIKRNPLAHQTSFDTYLVGLFLITVLSLSYSVDLGTSIRAIVELGSFIVLYFLVINVLTEVKYTKYLLSFLLGIGAALSIYGIYQYFIEYKQAYGLLNAYIAKDTLGARWDLVRGWLAQRRISSTFGLHNMFASFLGMVIPISLASVLYEKKIRTKLALITISLIMLLGMLLTFSIGGWLSLFFALGLEVMLLWRAQVHINPKAKRPQLVLLLTCAVIFVLAVSIIIGVKRFSPVTWKSFECRFMYLVSTVKIIEDYFLRGSGWGTFANVYLKYMFPGNVNPTADYATIHAHNLYLQIFAEIGIIGLLVFVAFVIKMVRYGFKKIIHFQDDYIRFSSIGVFSAVCFFLIHNLLDIGFYFFPVAIFWWFLVAILTAFQKLDAGVYYEKPLLPGSKRFIQPDILVWGIFSAVLIMLVVKNSLADLHFYRGSLYLNKGAFKESIEELEKAARLEPFNSIYPERLGDVYFQKASLSQASFLNTAKLNYLKAIGFSIYNAKVYYKLGFISDIQGHWQEAATYYKKAIYYYPAAEDYHRALGLLLLKKNQVKEAFLKYLDLIKINPRNPQNISFGAAVYEKMGIDKKTFH